MYGIAASFALFLAIKAGGRGPPRTMTKEHQEATNEYMKVRNPHRALAWTLHEAFVLGDVVASISAKSARHTRHLGGTSQIASVNMNINFRSLSGTQHRTHHGCLERGLRGQGYGTDGSEQRLAARGRGVSSLSCHARPQEIKLWRRRATRCTGFRLRGGPKHGTNRRCGREKGICILKRRRRETAFAAVQRTFAYKMTFVQLRCPRNLKHDDLHQPAILLKYLTYFPPVRLPGLHGNVSR